MRALREKDYDDMAGRVVDRFMRGETKLADAAVAEAMQGQLNPDQIERLVQAANAMAFLRMMEDRKAQGAPDMTHEFDPVDTHGVLQQIIGQTPMGGEHPALGLLGSSGEGHPEQHGMQPGMPPGATHAEPDGDEGPLPDEMSAHRGDGSDQEVHVHGDESEVHVHDDDSDGPFPKGEKQKAKEKSEKKDDEAGDKKEPPKKGPPKPAKKDESKEAAQHQRRMRKLADTLEDQFRQAELAFDEEYEQLMRQFKLAGGAPRFDAFEKDAMALADPTHGALVLNLLRQEHGLAPIAISDVQEKHATLADRHVSDDYPALRMFERLVKIAGEAGRVRRGAEYARSQCG